MGTEQVPGCRGRQRSFTPWCSPSWGASPSQRKPSSTASSPRRRRLCRSARTSCRSVPAPTSRHISVLAPGCPIACPIGSPSRHIPPCGMLPDVGSGAPKHPEARRFGAPSTPRPSPAWMPCWVGAGPGVSGVCSGMRGAGTPWYHTPYDLAGADEVPAVPAAGAGVHHLAGGGDPLHQPPRLHHHHQILGHRRQEPLPGGELRAPAPSIPAGSSHTAPCSPLQPHTAPYSPTQPLTPGPCRGAPTASPAPPGPWWLIPHT